MTVPLRTVPKPAVEEKPGLTVHKDAFGAGMALMGTTLASVGSGMAWGTGVGLFVAGILFAIFGVLLGIG